MFVALSRRPPTVNWLIALASWDVALGGAQRGASLAVERRLEIRTLAHLKSPAKKLPLKKDSLS
jgi:hypothetical protein